MSTRRIMDRICIAAILCGLLITALFMNGHALGIQAADHVMGYENRLFDAQRVHSIDIVMDDWDSFIDNCEDEAYRACSVVIDGEAYKNVGIRAKGNTSLSSVSSMNSDRYSFKIEFDQYDNTINYHGLDKLSLNNLIQDNTLMKDFLVYQMMDQFGAAAPLCSFVYVTVNGEDWGVYLAVEAVEESFLTRNYGSNYGDLYKPDSLSFGGGRGNGKDFNFDNLDFDFSNMPTDFSSGFENFGGFEGFGDFGSMDSSAFPMPGNMDFASFSPQDFMPSSSAPADMPADAASGATQTAPGESASGESSSESRSSRRDFGGMGGGFGGFGMGSSDVKLQYIDDSPESYSNIFSSAKTTVTDADQTRLIESLKKLSEGVDLENTVDMEAVMRYFVVHNFVCNGDSYTGSMIHNYYLYEKDGQLSMLPWDYNLAFGSFHGGNANSSVNESIDFNLTDRPMVSWIFENEAYTQRYYQLYEEFVAQYLDSGVVTQLVTDTAEMLRPYLQKDPTKFCTMEEFDQGVSTMLSFLTLRAQSVSGQLQGDNATVDASHLDLSDLGSMGGGFGGGFGGGRDRNQDSGSFPGQAPAAEDSQASDEGISQGFPGMPQGMQFPSASSEDGQGAASQGFPNMPQGMQFPSASSEDGQGASSQGFPGMPQGMQFPSASSEDGQGAASQGFPNMPQGMQFPSSSAEDGQGASSQGFPGMPQGMQFPSASSEDGQGASSQGFPGMPQGMQFSSSSSEDGQGAASQGFPNMPQGMQFSSASSEDGQGMTSQGFPGMPQGIQFSSASSEDGQDASSQGFPGMPQGMQFPGFSSGTEQSVPSEDATAAEEIQSSEELQSSPSGMSQRRSEGMSFAFPQGTMQSSASSSESWILLGASCLVMVLGLLFAFRFKRW